MGSNSIPAFPDALDLDAIRAQDPAAAEQIGACWASMVESGASDEEVVAMCRLLERFGDRDAMEAVFRDAGCYVGRLEKLRREFPVVLSAFDNAVDAFQHRYGVEWRSRAPADAFCSVFEVLWAPDVERYRDVVARMLHLDDCAVEFCKEQDIVADVRVGSKANALPMLYGPGGWRIDYAHVGVRWLQKS